MSEIRRSSRLTDRFAPSDCELLAWVQRDPGLTLRRLCRLIWPALPWSASTQEADSATGRVREWPSSPGAGSVGSRGQRTTAALWLRDRMEVLVEAGLVRHGRRQRNEVDALASLTYLPRVLPQEPVRSHDLTAAMTAPC